MPQKRTDSVDSFIRPNSNEPNNIRFQYVLVNLDYLQGRCA